METTVILPKIMRRAREDLMGNASGDFSPEDWALVLQLANERLAAFQGAGLSEDSAWAEVIREFHRERYWGYRPDYKAPRVRDSNMGIRFILMTGLTFIFSIIAVVWLGQIYTSSGEFEDGRNLVVAIVLILCNFGFFLWYHRQHED